MYRGNAARGSEQIFHIKTSNRKQVLLRQTYVINIKDERKRKKKMAATDLEVKRDWMAHMRDITDLDQCPDKLLDVFYDLFSTKYNFTFSIDQVADWLHDFNAAKGTDKDTRDNLVKVLKRDFAEVADWKETPPVRIRVGARGQKRKQYLLSNTTVKKLLMRFSSLVQTYYITIEHLYQTWMRDTINERLQQESPEVTQAKLKPSLKHLPDEGGNYVVEIIDEQSPKRDGKYRFGDTVSGKYRWPVSRRSIHGTAYLSEWLPHPDHKAIDACVKLKMTRDLAPGMEGKEGCTETFLTTKEKLFRIYGACKLGNSYVDKLLDDTTWSPPSK